MAAYRAIENERPNRLFEDSLAARLASSETLAIVREKQESDKTYVPVRTRFFDDFISKNALILRQVVVLWAGMDTRVFRLDWSHKPMSMK